MADNVRTVIFTDGACIGNPGPGGWAWAESKDRFRAGFEANTTNQRMEVRAVIEALSVVPGPVEIVSDSTYVVNCFRDRWWATWLAKGWRNSRGQPVANRDLWEQLVKAVIDERGEDVVFTWVRGHNGDPMNELVDQLANTAARTQDESGSDEVF